MKTNHKLIVLLVAAAIMAVLAVLMSFSTFRQIKEAAEARKHTYEVIHLADGLLSALKDAETGERGYALTGDEAFLEPYLEVRDNVKGNLEELGKLTFISAAHKQLRAMAPLMDAKLAELAHVIELRRNNDMAALLEIVRDGQGKRLMDSIRGEMSSFIQIEEDALAQHDAALQSDMRNMFAIIVAVTLLTMLCALLFAYMIYRDARHQISDLLHLETQRLLEIREDMNKRLRQANDTLQISQENLAVTLSSIGDAVIATDSEGNITLLNPIAEQLTGWTPMEAIGRQIDEIVHVINQETRQPSAFPIRETLKNGTIHFLTNHTVLISRNGSECIIADSCAPIRDRDGKVLGAVLVFRDITKEYVSQQALRDSEGQYRQLFESSSEALMVLIPPSWTFTDANNATLHLFGATSKADLIALKPGDISPEYQPDGRLSAEKAQDMISIALSEGSHFYEWENRRLNGETFPSEVLLTRMEARGLVWLQATVRDLSAQKEAEEAVIKAGTLQNAIFNSANFSSIATDARGVIQIFNVGAERMLGYKAVEVVDKVTPADISDPVEVIKRAKALSKELDTPIRPGFEALVFKASRGIEDIYELTYIRKDGSRFSAVVSVTALRDDHEAIIGYLLIGTDNTARKQIEAEQKKLDQRLRDQQFYTRSLIESNIDALITTDTSGIITDTNKQMEALTGCTRDELIGAPFKNYFTDPERADASIKLALNEKKVTDYELTARGRFGKETVVSYNATTFYDRDRRLQGVVAVARDITERKRLDHVLHENNVELENSKSVAEKANLAKSDFLSSMSHELRSPLNAILGFAQLMDSASPIPTSSQKESIGQILQAGWHLLKLINEILDLSVIESGRVSLSPESVSLPEIMSECQTMMESQAQQRGISMSFPHFDHPLFVRADRTRLKQIVINLLSNAIKYNKEQGTVIVSCTETIPDRIRISIADTGTGLSPEKLAQLFQPFNRLGQEASSVAGTGIGLVVTKRLAELMDGVLGVESTVGEGSVFWCELMLVEAPKLIVEDGEDEPVVASEPDGLSRQTLLYVEDNPANMKLVEQLIARFPNLRLLTAVNGTLGINLARSTQPKVILMDINLPGISGIEALKVLREDPATAHIPVIALSANAMPRDIKRGLELGFFRYITKPIKVKEFMDTLNLALEYAVEKNSVIPQDD